VLIFLGFGAKLVRVT
jgi:hypothetical protein